MALSRRLSYRRARIGRKCHFQGQLGPRPADPCIKSGARVYAGSHYFRSVRAQLLGSGLVLGLTAGLIRMAEGGHYFSDVVFAAVFMALVVLVLHWIFFRREYGYGPPPN